MLLLLPFGAYIIKASNQGDVAQAAFITSKLTTGCWSVQRDISSSIL
jgi:hypothetical protein